MGRNVKPKPLEGLRVCYFGHYNPSYSRNRILMKALRRAGAQVVEVCSRERGLTRYRALFRKAVRIPFDVMLVGFPGHTDMPLARLLCSLKRRPLFFDAFLSLYETSVEDRQLVKPQSFTATRLFWMDKLACWLADVVLLDTATHIDYFVQTFRIPRAKFRRVWVGADDDIMKPAPAALPPEQFTVFFYGTFIPLHGIDHIVRAAKILQDAGDNVRFVIVGNGQTFTQVRRTANDLNVSNVTFLGRVPYEALPNLMLRSHVCLGIFGDTPKAMRVIPNKVFDGLAVARPVITAETPAVHEAFTPGEHILTCRPADPQALAQAIILLKSDYDLRTRLSKLGYSLFKENFSIDALSTIVGGIVLDAMSNGHDKKVIMA